ncbi:MAG TPA: hypothetical protein VGQ80_01220, partial [Acidimicrobiia bacterium]|nr:hypothetical protein [Acidimicrobiia bacterium]
MKTHPYAGSWMKLGQLAAVAPMVIGYRLAGMALAGPEPSARDRREVNRMGQEKVEAWYEAAQAAGMRLLQANMAMATLGSDLLADTLAPYH